MMDIQTLDFLFPFFVLMYGALITIVLNIPQLEKLALKKVSDGTFPEQLYKQMQAHRILAMICLFIGAIWSLQNIWAGPGHLFAF